MTRKLRNDVVIEKAAGVYMLIAKRPAWGKCPFIYEIGPMAAYFWEAMNSGKNEDEMISYAAGNWNISLNSADRFYRNFIKSAELNHYFVDEDEIE